MESDSAAILPDILNFYESLGAHYIKQWIKVLPSFDNSYIIPIRYLYRFNNMREAGGLNIYTIGMTYNFLSNADRQNSLVVSDSRRILYGKLL